LVVAVTGAAGQIGYAFVPLLSNGSVFGPDVMIHLRLLDVAQAQKKLEGVSLELQDGAYPNLLSVDYGDDPNKIFKDADVVVFIGGFPRKQGQERKDLLLTNGNIFVGQGKALDTVAKKTVKSLVVANPANTNCLILQTNAPSIPKENFTCLTRLDQNRAYSQVAAKAGVPVTSVKNIVIWGNHSTTQYPDLTRATIDGKDAKKVVRDNEWVENAFISRVQKRGGEILQVMGLTSVFSAANAVKDHLRDWYFGSHDVVSMGVVSKGDYNTPKDIVYSLPLKLTGNWKWEVVQGWEISEFSREKLEASAKELEEEKTIAFAALEEAAKQKAEEAQKTPEEVKPTA
jgi:malate dehydrogenase